MPRTDDKPPAPPHFADTLTAFRESYAAYELAADAMEHSDSATHEAAVSAYRRALSTFENRTQHLAFAVSAHFRTEG